MKNLVIPKLVLFFLSVAVVLTACQKENIDITDTVTPDPTASAKILGEWEVYKVEKEELVFEYDTDGNLTWEYGWFDQTSSMANESTIEFSDDNTFTDFYAGVLVFVGNWSEVNESEFTLTFDPDESPAGSEWSDITTDYIVTVYCDNTMSVEYIIASPAGDNGMEAYDRHYTSYFRTPGTTECDDLINYHVE
jgi:hypothetical protein